MCSINMYALDKILLGLESTCVTRLQCCNAPKPPAHVPRLSLCAINSCGLRRSGGGGRGGRRRTGRGAVRRGAVVWKAPAGTEPDPGCMGSELPPCERGRSRRKGPVGTSGGQKVLELENWAKRDREALCRLSRPSLKAAR